MSIISSILSDSSLGSLTLPFVYIGNYAFQSCTSLSSVSFPNAVSIGGSAFQKCSSLTSVDFPNATIIGEWAFNSCPGLTSVFFPNVTDIKNYAISNCSSLTSASLPSVTSIGTQAFATCPKLTTLYIGTNTSTVCTLSNTNAIPSNVTKIYVPPALVDSYKSATNWSSFASKIVSYSSGSRCNSNWRKDIL